MKALTFVVGLLASQVLHAQSVSLGDPIGIDVRVDHVDWQPRGEALLYTRLEGEGRGIGVYAVGQREGKVLLHLTEDEQWEAQWFESTTSAIVITYRRVLRGAEKVREAAVHILDAKALTDRTVFSQTVPEGSKIDLDVDPSPLFVHAIFRIKIAEKSYHYVLPKDGGRLVACSDLDRAVNEGYQGPGWTIDGTAVYVKLEEGGSSELAKSERLAIDLLLSSRLRQKAYESEKVPILGDLPVLGKLFRARNPFPGAQVGDSVLELMLANPVLRPVKYRGPWKEDDFKEAPLQAEVVQGPVVFGLVKSMTESLWVSHPEAKEKTLAAADVNAVWTAPRNKAVAFTVDGALFVRPVK